MGGETGDSGGKHMQARGHATSFSLSLSLSLSLSFVITQTPTCAGCMPVHTHANTHSHEGEGGGREAKKGKQGEGSDSAPWTALVCNTGWRCCRPASSREGKGMERGRRVTGEIRGV